MLVCSGENVGGVGMRCINYVVIGTKTKPTQPSAYRQHGETHCHEDLQKRGSGRVYLCYVYDQL
jgi:hypothetical protein